LLQAASAEDAAKSARHNVAVSVYAQVTFSAHGFIRFCAVCFLQAASGEDAAKSAWQEAAIDLASLLPSFMRDDAAKELPKVFAKYDAQYLA
jgi:hypothetical protein